MLLGRQGVAQERRIVLQRQKIVQAPRTGLVRRLIVLANPITIVRERRRIAPARQRRVLKIRIARQIVVKPRLGLKIRTSPASQIEG